MTNIEEWRAIANHPDYEVSNLGNVRSYKNYRNGGGSTHPLHPIMCPTPSVVFWKHGKKGNYSVGKLVYETFSGEKARLVRHKDGNIHNAEFTNLYNCPKYDKVLKGRRRGENHPLVRLTQQQVLDARRMVGSGESNITELAKKYNVHVSTMSKAISGKTWKWAGVEGYPVSSLIVEVTTISEIKMHPAADKLEIAVCRGWQCVVGKGQFVVGDKVVYIPIDTIIPQELSDRLGVTQYLSKQHIRCARLRGEPSFGLVIKPDEDWPIGTDVAAYYNCQKYDPPIKTLGEQQERDHALFVKYTDIENIKNFPDVFKDGELVWVSEKLHGCLRSNTLIRMGNGTEKPITFIDKGDMVQGYSNGAQVISVVDEVIYRPPTKKVKWIELSFDNGRTIECTGDHLIYTANRGYVPAIDLSEKDDVIT